MEQTLEQASRSSTVLGKLSRLPLAGGPSGVWDRAAARPTRTHADAAAPSCAQETHSPVRPVVHEEEAGAAAHRVFTVF